MLKRRRFPILIRTYTSLSLPACGFLPPTNNETWNSNQDVRSVIAWLCYGGYTNPEESCKNILKRVLAYKRGKLDEDLDVKMDEEAWVRLLPPPGQGSW